MGFSVWSGKGKKRIAFNLRSGLFCDEPSYRFCSRPSRRVAVKTVRRKKIYTRGKSVHLHLA